MLSEQIKTLEEETKKIFLKCDIKPPKKVLPDIIFSWMTPEDCFKTRIRTILFEIKTSKNFYGLDENGDIIFHPKQEKICLVKNKEGYEKSKEIINQIKKLSGIDVTKI